MTDQQASGAPVPVFREGFCAAQSRRYILITAILASSMGFIDGTVVAIALPAMRGTLGASLSQAQWFSNAYMLTLSALILLGGALGDKLGLARVFGGGIAVFMAASLACALAPTSETLIAARALKGLGAAFMIPGSLAIISRAYPREERGRAIGIWAAASALTTALGPIIGGTALTWGGPEMWRWIFAVNLPFGALALWLLTTHVRENVTVPDRGLDLPGAALATLGLGLLAYGLTSGAAWAGLAGAVTCGLFLLIEAQSPHPMMPLGLFRDRTFAAANLATFTLYFSLSAIFFFLPMTLIAGWGESEIAASAAFVPLTVFIASLSSRIGALADKTGPGPLIGTGALLVAAGYAALAATLPWQDFWRLTLPAMGLTGLGMAFVVGPLSTAVMAAASDENQGTASGINNALSRMAGLIAVAAMGPLTAFAYGAAGGAASFGVPSDTAGHAEAMNRAFATVAWICAGLAALSGIIAFTGVRPQASISR